MATKQVFRLTATHPSGRVMDYAPSSLRDAQLHLSYSIYDNGYGDKRTAQTACIVKPGEPLEIGGATYLIEKVAA